MYEQTRRPQIRRVAMMAGEQINVQPRVSHITPFFKLSYTLLTTHALGLYEVVLEF